MPQETNWEAMGPRIYNSESYEGRAPHREMRWIKFSRKLLVRHREGHKVFYLQENLTLSVGRLLVF